MRHARRGLGLLARIIRLVTLAVAAVIVFGILFQVLEANSNNVVVQAITDAARFLVGPFREMFRLDNPDVQVAVNWGIGAAVWVIVGALVAALLRRP
ncbi:MAG TPA: hypothetical protein VK992_04220 [Candidatus Caenarcaniphilales bacterium]|nr:hypothetical protein [Candidatus Caenarcaniphilales bacterium]